MWHWLLKVPSHTFVIVEGRVTPPKQMNVRTLKEGFLSMKLKQIFNMIFQKWGGGSKAVWNFSENRPFWRRHPSLRGFDRTWNLLHQNSELNLFYLRNVRQRFLTGLSIGCLHLFALLSKYVFAFRFVSKFSRSFSHKILLLQQIMQHKYKRYKNVNFNI